MKTIVLIIIGVLIIVPASTVLWIFGNLYFAARDAKQRQVIILYKTDHEALLEACRKVLDESRDGKWERQKMYSIRRDPDPDAGKFPKAILDIKPSYLFIDESGSLIIEMMGGMGHFGVIAHPKDFKGPLDEWEHDKKLIEGLWYYDDGYRESTKYEKIIESLKPKDK